MKEIVFRKSVAPAAVCAGLCLTGGALKINAQLTSSQKEQLNDLIGHRAEVAIVLGAANSASAGSYNVDGRHGNNDSNFDLYKFGGAGEIGDPRQLGNSGVKWVPYIVGNAGYMTGQNDFTVGSLSGNEVNEDAIGLQLGGGVSFYLNDQFSITPTVGVVYGHYKIELDSHNANGDAARRFIDNDIDTIGFTPGILLAYKIPIGENILTLSASYSYFYSSDISSDNDLELTGNSHILEQKADIDIPLNAELWNCRLHTGGYISFTEALGDIS